ncbi:MAG: TIGR00730 family Rossman fold protein [Leucobacter sp.]
MDTTPDDAISELLRQSGVRKHRKLVAQLVETSLGLGQDKTGRANLKLSSAALTEMRRAFQLFAGHEDTPKVTIFGSARTLADDPLWTQAEAIARGLSEQGWMVVTGAGPGIMEAAATGAGPEMSLGVSIRLPFEEKPNDMINQDGNHVAMKYFFTRKLMLVKESSGFVCLPGGFGTLDETFELLTLQQTGKMVPVPIVLLDRPGGSFWRGFERFVREDLTDYGMISADDLDRVLITDSVEEAVAEIEAFWSNYDSLRWIPNRGEEEVLDPSPGTAATPSAGRSAGDRLVLRLRSAPSDEELAKLNERFAHLLADGQIERTEPLPPEVSDRDRLELPRVTLIPNPRAVGRLHNLIRALNDL